AVAPARVSEREGRQVGRLAPQDLLEVRVLPDAAVGVLVGAAPDGVDELRPLGGERRPRALVRGAIAGEPAAHLELDGIDVEELVHVAPARVLAVVAGVEAGEEL